MTASSRDQGARLEFGKLRDKAERQVGAEPCPHAVRTMKDATPCARPLLWRVGFVCTIGDPWAGGAWPGHHAMERQTRVMALCLGGCRAKVHHKTRRPVR